MKNIDWKSILWTLSNNKLNAVTVVLQNKLISYKNHHPEQKFHLLQDSLKLSPRVRDKSVLAYQDAATIDFKDKWLEVTGFVMVTIFEVQMHIGILTIFQLNSALLID